MNQQVLQQSHKREHRQNLRQQESRQHQNVCLELQQEIYNIRKETAKITQEHLKLKEQIEERDLEFQEYLRTQNVLNENLLGMHVQNESTRVKIKSKEETLLKLMQKRSEVEEICSAIQALCDPLSCVLIDIVQAKEEVSNYNSITQENLEKLKEKFQHISDKSALLKKNLNDIALNEEEEIENEKARKLREIALAKDNLQTLWNQLGTSMKELNAKKEDIMVAEQENKNTTFENEYLLEELKKLIQIEENHYDSKTNISSSLRKEVIEMEIDHKRIVEEINQWELQISNLKSDSTELQLKSKALNEELVMKKKRYEEVQENAVNMKAALETCETEVQNVKLHSEEQDSNFHIVKEELQNIVCLNKEKKAEISKLQSKLEEKVLQVEEQKFTAVREVEELKATIKTKENELSSSLIDLQRAKELLTALEEQYKQHEDLQIQIQQENQHLQTDHASNVEKLEELNATLVHKNAESESLFSLLTDIEAELRQLTEDLDKAQRKYDETVNLKEREKLEVDLELKNAIREMEKTESNCHWIMQQTMACVDSCKQNYAKHVEDKKQELQACKSEKLQLVNQLSEICAEKDECKAKLENEVLQLEKAVKELEIQLKKEIESNGNIVASPGVLPRAQQNPQHSTGVTLEKFTYKEPKMSVSSIGHTVSPFAEHYKKQPTKRKQTEVFSFKSKSLLSMPNQEPLSQPLEIPGKPLKNLANKFFRTKLLPTIEEKMPNDIEDFDYYKFE